MTAPKKTAAQPDLAAEERRRRVERVRAVATGELRQIENTLLDVQARLPRLLSEVQQARRTIEANTTVPNGGETS